MEELNIMRRILRQNNIKKKSQTKFEEGYYCFSVDKSKDFPLGYVLIVDINKYPKASQFKVPVYTRKNSKDKDKKEQHYALLNSLEGILLEHESAEFLKDSFKDFMGVVKFDKYKAQINKMAEDLKTTSNMPSAQRGRS